MHAIGTKMRLSRATGVLLPIEDEEVAMNKVMEPAEIPASPGP